VDPDHAQALTYLGDIEMKETIQSKPWHCSAKPCTCGTTFVSPMSIWDPFLAQQGQHQDAIAALQRAVKLDPTPTRRSLPPGTRISTMGNTSASQKEFATVRELHQKQ